MSTVPWEPIISTYFDNLGKVPRLDGVDTLAADRPNTTLGKINLFKIHHFTLPLYIAITFEPMMELKKIL